jgi:hypothetical protein
MPSSGLHFIKGGMSLFDLSEVFVRIVLPFEEQRFRQLMQEYHYLGALPKISETLWHVAVHGEQWVALLSFSAPALKCSARDRWIGWDFHHQYDRLKLITNNSRFLILPEWHLPNIASRILSLSRKRLPSDWQAAFGHPLVLLETFVDPQRFHGAIYKADNWIYAGNTRGFSRIKNGYSAIADSPKMVFLKPLISNVQRLLSQPVLEPKYLTGGKKIMISAQEMESLPDFFRAIPDPRRVQGRRHKLSTVLAIAAGAALCGMRGYLAMADWAQGLQKKARKRFGCRYQNNKYIVPSLNTIRDVLMRVDPVHIDRAMQKWNQKYGKNDDALAIDGKTMCNAIDEQGHQVHIMSAIGHQTKACYTQKKQEPSPYPNKR